MPTQFPPDDNLDDKRKQEILRRARERVAEEPSASGACTQPPLENPLDYHLRDIGFCECFPAEQRISVLLTPMEIRVLARLHLNQVHDFQAFVRTGGYVGGTDIRSTAYHESRFYDMAELLPEGDQEAFRKLRELRSAYIATLQDREEAVD